MTETWRPIPGATRYRVSNEGRVRTPAGRVLKYQLDDGYPRLALVFDDGKRRQVKVSQAVAWAFIGPPPAGMVVRHLDGGRDNNVPSNLAYGTPADNAQDSLRHGTNHQANKATCPRGHDLAGDNLVVLSTRPNERRCRACIKQLGAAYREKRPRARRNRRKGDETCQRGHPITADSIDKHGRCRPCRAEAARAARARQRSGATL